MVKVRNPIIRGFNPDPSIIRVGKDFYIATSTFEWFPGVQIHHSKNLADWRLIKRPLNRKSQLDMLGVPDSCGVWAPCLSHYEDTFYLIYSNVKSFDGIWKDTPNYLVTTQDISDEWSDPIFIDSSGFDGSLFHDYDGRKWYSSMITDHRKGKFFGGIILQEYDHSQRKLIGKKYRIFEGTELGATEAPHIYKRNGYYYLITAEGGTEYGHAISLARSRKIIGPYELHPGNPILSARNYPNASLQKCGHGDLVDTAEGNWYSVFLTGRPLSIRGRCTLGRETAIAPMIWEDDNWLYHKEGSNPPLLEIEISGIKSNEGSLKNLDRDNFDKAELNSHFQSLRIPITDEWASLSSRIGFLRLYGRESLNSLHNQSLIARRVQSFHIEASTCLEFSPSSFQNIAGLVCYYNTAHWYYLNIFGDEDGTSKYLQIIASDNFEMNDIIPEPVNISNQSKIYLKVVFKKADIQFYYGFFENDWRPIGPTLDGSKLSDDYVREGSNRYRPAFTGAFVGICCQDLSGQGCHADFDWWDYNEKND